MDASGKTPLDYAQKKKRAKVVECLVSVGGRTSEGRISDISEAVPSKESM
jgi:hypothetical protein